MTTPGIAGRLLIERDCVERVVIPQVFIFTQKKSAPFFCTEHLDLRGANAAIARGGHFHRTAFRSPLGTIAFWTMPRFLDDMCRNNYER